MLLDPKLNDEPARLAALQRYEVLDTAPEHNFDRITQLVQAVLAAPICTIALIDSDRQWFKSCIGLRSHETGRDIAFCSHTIQHREPLHVTDALLDPRFASNSLVTGDPFIRSYLGVPLATPDGYNLGSLCAIDMVTREYTPEQVEVMKSFAALVTGEMELRRIATTDHLTGAANRRAFILEAGKARTRFSTTGHLSTLLMLDIDHFKQVNDTYGHATGDAVLRKVGDTLTSHLGISDTLGRLGGEEFGILLHGMDLATAMRHAETLRLALAHATIDREPNLRFTASFGVATMSDDIASVDDWLATADRALYAAKHNGRNQVHAATPQP
jgi:diguanylate cyclase (GGDEF)-like protein